MRALYKASNTVRIGTVALDADPDLAFTMDANSTYLVRGALRFRGSTAGDIQHGFSVGGASVTLASAMSFGWRYNRADGLTVYEESGGFWTKSMIQAGSTRPKAMADGAYFWPCAFSLMVRVGSPGGVFSLIWAQSTADALGDAILMAGSMLTYEKLP